MLNLFKYLGGDKVKRVMAGDMKCFSVLQEKIILSTDRRERKRVLESTF